MTQVKVAFLGSRPLGKIALQILNELSNVEIVASVVKEPPLKAWWKDDPFYIAKKPLKSHEDLKNIEFDLGLSVNYWRYINPLILEIPNLGFVNMHHSYNLSLRGRNMTSMAILSAKKLNKWYHGTSLHYMDESLDTGPIIASSACQITKTDTAWSLFCKVEKLGAELLHQWLPRIILSKVPSAYPSKNQPIFLKARDKDLYLKDIFIEPEYSFDFVRAFDFNRYFDLAFTVINMKKIYLTTNPKKGEMPLLKIDSERIIYSAQE